MKRRPRGKESFAIKFLQKAPTKAVMMTKGWPAAPKQDAGSAKRKVVRFCLCPVAKNLCHFPTAARNFSANTMIEDTGRPDTTEDCICQKMCRIEEK